MKKILLVFNILFVFFAVLFFTQTRTVSAQNTCADTVNGCIICFYNESTDSKFHYSNTLCKNNADAPADSQEGLEALCNSKVYTGNLYEEISCIPHSVPNTLWTCTTATRTCNSCTEGNCPVGAITYSTETNCLDVCRNTTPQTCTGFCRTSCQTGETIDYGGSCNTQGQMCCKPDAGNPAGCTAQGGSCKASCGTGESGGTSSFCTAPNNKCCYPDAQANQGSVVSVNLKGSCKNLNEIDTAIGCIPIGDVNTFAAFFLRWGLGIAGGIGMIFLVYSSFMIITSQGDPKRLQVGKELLMSAISGIIMLALSLFIFRILGINILGLF